MTTQSLVNTPVKAFTIEFQWILANGLGWVIGNWFASHAIIYLINFFAIDTFNGPSVNTAAIGFTKGLLVGTIIGAFQYAIIRKTIYPAKFWILSNSIGWAFAHMAGSWANWTVFQSSPTSLDIEIVANGTEFIAIGICASFSLAILQWFLVKKNIANPEKWFLISTLSWSASLLTYAVFIYVAFAIPMNNGFVGIANTMPGLIVDLINYMSLIIYQSIGITAGVITSRAFVFKLKNT